MLGGTNKFDHTCSQRQRWIRYFVIHNACSKPTSEKTVNASSSDLANFPSGADRRAKHACNLHTVTANKQKEHGYFIIFHSTTLHPSIHSQLFKDPSIYHTSKHAKKSDFATVSSQGKDRNQVTCLWTKIALHLLQYPQAEPWKAASTW